MNNTSILMSIQPMWVSKILNGKKTIEVRKKFPKDYVGWVYIYCTKGEPHIMRGVHSIIADIKFDKNFKYYLNGKVVARFWCDKVSVIERYSGTFIPISGYTTFLDKRYSYEGLKQATCLNDEELHRYLGNKNGYAIHISKLEVFEKPMELKEFRHTCKADYRGYNRWQPCSKECKNCICNQLDDEGYSQCFSRLTKAPQSWCYIEGE